MEKRQDFPEVEKIYKLKSPGHFTILSMIRKKKVTPEHITVKLLKYLKQKP